MFDTSTLKRKRRIENITSKASRNISKDKNQFDTSFPQIISHNYIENSKIQSLDYSTSELNQPIQQIEKEIKILNSFQVNFDSFYQIISFLNKMNRIIFRLSFKSSYWFTTKCFKSST
jgi:hypothetical protein